VTLEDVTSLAAAPSGRLRIGVASVSTAILVRRRLSDFLALYPDIFLDIHVGSETHAQRDFDAMIRAGWRLERDVGGIPVAKPMSGAVFCAPSYLKRRPIPKSPAELLNYRCVRLRRADGVLPVWEFEKDGREVTLDPANSLIVDDAEDLIAAVVSGIGFGLIADDHVSSLVGIGKLIPTLRDWSPKGTTPLLYWDEAKPARPPLTALVRYLREQIASA
jgi:DNA-binding transcriptional LysR family regulator